MPQMKDLPKGNRIIVTVIGPDKIGIIAAVTSVLAECRVNILDISQTVMQEFLVMVLVADMTAASVELARLKERLSEVGRDLQVRIDAQHEDLFSFMHRI